jgi:thymidylate synthase ThyX
MAFSAKVLADSVSPAGHRLTTLEVTMPRIVLAEFNTHRMFCLAGDVQLEFDLPTGTKDKYRRVWTMRLDEFVDKWVHGARRFAANPKREYDLSWVESHRAYTANEVAARMGMANPSAVNSACRSGAIKGAYKNLADGPWLVPAESLLAWRKSVPEHTRFDMRSKLAGMKIRQLNEQTGDIQTANVVDAVESGVKKVFEVVAGDFTIPGSADHRIFTTDGWKVIGDIKRGDHIVVRKFGKKEDDRLDPMRLKKIDGIWRNGWQVDQRSRLQGISPLCRRCGEVPGDQIHHIEPVYQNPGRAFDETNITLLCDPCHNVMHERQGWQGGTYLYGAAVEVEEVQYRGTEKTYDLSVSGDFPNFLANGVVVHNSRSSASSRAIPVEKRIAALETDPFIPEAFGKNQKGMQSSEQLDEVADLQARAIWVQALETAKHFAGRLAEVGVHKQLANRLIEPFCWHTVIVSSTEFSNFWGLRISPLAQPEIQRPAALMREAMNASTPKRVGYDEWHTPLVPDRVELVEGGYTPRQIAEISVGRCARVSYLTHEGKRDPSADLTLYERLVSSGHMSPLEHVAMPCTDALQHEFVGNFFGWFQLRKTIPGEQDFSLRPKE